MSTTQEFPTCIGKTWYERTRGLSAFNVTGDSKRSKNQHATVYTFPDGSQFIVYRDFGKAYRDADGLIQARRTNHSDSAY